MMQDNAFQTFDFLDCLYNQTYKPKAKQIFFIFFFP